MTEVRDMKMLARLDSEIARRHKTIRELEGYQRLIEAMIREDLTQLMLVGQNTCPHCKRPSE